MPLAPHRPPVSAHVTAAVIMRRPCRFYGDRSRQPGIRGLPDEGLSAGKPGLPQENGDKLAAPPVSGGGPPEPTVPLPLGTENTSAELPLTEVSGGPERGRARLGNTNTRVRAMLASAPSSDTDAQTSVRVRVPHESPGGPRRGRGGERSAPGLSEAGSPPRGSPHEART